MGKIYDDKQLVNYYMAGGKMPTGMGCGFFPVFIIISFIILMPFMFIFVVHPIIGFLGGETIIMAFIGCWHYKSGLGWKKFLIDTALYTAGWLIWLGIVWYNTYY